MANFVNMRSSVVTSVSAHLLLVLFAQFGLPHVFTPPDVAVTIIPVDLVTIDDLDTPPPPAAPEPEPEPEAAAPPPPPPEPPPEPPAPPEPEVVEAPPPPPVVKPKPPEKKEPPKPKPEPPELAKAKPQAKPKPPKPAKDFNSVLKDLAKIEKTPTLAKKARKPSPPKDEGKPAPEQQLAERASITEIERLKQLIRRQIEPCWSPPVGAVEAENLVVTIFIRVDQRGFVREARIVDAPAMALNSYVQAAADAARRAVLNPRCQPFNLPQNRYDLWKEIRFNFDPREMLG
jgi:outer membrane biosynthesis protein TonB